MPRPDALSNKKMKHPSSQSFDSLPLFSCYRTHLPTLRNGGSRPPHRNTISRSLIDLAYLGKNVPGSRHTRSHQPRKSRSAQGGMSAWPPERNAIAAPVQMMAGFSESRPRNQ